MSRKRKLLINTAAGILRQCVVIICELILSRRMLLYYGSSVNGLVSSVTHFLGFISFLDMGVGAVTQANLYAPLAEKDYAQLSRIIKSSQRFFRQLACIFLGYTGFLCLAFPILLNTEFSTWFSVSLLLILSISTFAQYFFGLTYQLLLNADQKSYIPLFIQILTTVINTIFSLSLIRLNASVQIVKFGTSFVYMLRPLILTLYVKKYYKIDSRIVLYEEPIQQKWYGFSQHIAAVICDNIDIAVLTVFSTLKNVSVYSVYYRVIMGVESIQALTSTGLESLFGNMIARKEKKKLLLTFEFFEWITHTSVSFLFTVTVITIVPFVSIYTQGVQDVEYCLPIFASLLTAAYAFKCLRFVYFIVIKAAGHFKETQNGAYISALLNVVITITLVFRYGLPGTALGTFAAMFYHNCYCVWYLSRHILERPVRHFVTYLLSDCMTAAITFLLTRGFSLSSISYPAWAALACKVFGITFVMSAVVQCMFYRGQIKYAICLIHRKS